MSKKNSFVPELSASSDKTTMLSAGQTKDGMLEYYQKSLESSKITPGNNKLANQAEESYKKYME